MARVLFTSVPKCGTHLLLRYLDYLGRPCAGPHVATSYDDRLLEFVRQMPDGSYSAFHYPWTKALSALTRERDIKVVLLYRDPRAQVVSRMRFIERSPEHPFAQFIARIPSPDERLVRLIQGFSADDLAGYGGATHLRVNFDPGFGGLLEAGDASGRGPCSSGRGGVNDLYRCFARWLDEPHCCSVRFEDIVGARGGGDDPLQRETVRRLLAFTDTPDATRDAGHIAAALYDTSTDTFDRGRTDSWRRDMSAEVQCIFQLESSALLDLWGYADAEPEAGP